MTRRVGTFTLGVSLIVIGIIIPLALIFPDSALKLIQLSPLLLIGLGVEILYYAFTVKKEEGQKLRYDGLSIFIVICISIVTIGASTITPIAKNYYKFYRESMVITDEIEGAIYDVMEKNDYSGNVNIYNVNYGDFFIPVNTNGKYDYECHMNLSLYFDQEMTKEEAAAAIDNVINGADKRIKYMNINVDCTGYNYNITLIGSSFNSTTAQSIANRIRVTNKDNNYDREHRYNSSRETYESGYESSSQNDSSTDSSEESSSTYVSE